MLIITTTTCLATTTVLLLTGLLQSTCQAQTAPETAAPASTPFSPSPDCEASVLAALNESTAFQCHRLHIVWQPSFNPVWQNLSCLNSLTSLGITGALPDLPDAWSSSGSFPALQSLDLSGAFLAGMPAPTSTHKHPHTPTCTHVHLHIPYHMHLNCLWPQHGYTLSETKLLQVATNSSKRCAHISICQQSLLLLH